MHESVQNLIGGLAAAGHFADRDVLEVGSLAVNGSVRGLITPTANSYWGVDLVEGESVDQVADAESLPEEWAGRFSAVISLECFEHATRVWKVASEMRRVAAPGAVAVVTCRGFDATRGSFQFHHPPDLWRFSEAGLVALLEDAGWQSVEARADEQVPGYFALARA